MNATTAKTAMQTGYRGSERVLSILRSGSVFMYIFGTAETSPHNTSIIRVVHEQFCMKKDTKGSKMSFKPAGDRVLVKPHAQEDEKTASGIIIPDTARKEKPERGTVVAVGEGKRNERGELIAMRCKVGDEVMFSKYGYDEVTIDDVEYYVVSESNILGTF